MNETTKSYIRSIFIGILMGLLLASIFGLGFFLRDILDRRFTRELLGSPNVYPLLSEVELLVQQKYLRDLPSYEQLQYGVVRGYLASLGDRNTFFIEPPVAQSESQVLAGTYGGIGVLIRRNDAGNIELYPIEETPASQVGIQNGEVLVAINDVEIVLTMQQDAIDQMLRGEVKDGNGVTLTIRDLQGKTRDIFVEFAVINIPSVFWRVLVEDSRIGYIQLIRFTSRTPDELIQAITELKENNVSALILDLRNNGGGLLNESLDVVNQFIGDGIIAYEVDQNAEQIYEASSGGLVLDLPLVILVNGNTASASEIVAGAIRDRERGILIGQKTFGKGTVQQIFSLSDGSSVHVTFAEWLPPSRVSLDGIGLEPDIAMIPDENGRDVELAEAVRYLRTELE
jgi:carboxyl-terminal processing protease